MERKQNNSDFTMKLYQNLVENEKNIFFSSYSVSTVLSMVLLGSKGNTATELKSVLGFAPDDSESALHVRNLQVAKKLQEGTNKWALETANKLFSDSTFDIIEEFVNDCKKFYLSSVENVNFQGKPDQSRQKINAWVDKQTHGRIKDILPKGSVDCFTRLVIVNAVYFKGDWEDKFNPRHTNPKDFFVEQKQSIPVEMMWKFGKFHTKFDRGLGVRVVELPYEGGDVSMFVLLPRQRMGLIKMEKQLTTNKLHELTTELSKKLIFLSLPKMQVEQELDVVKILKQLGVKDVFIELDANLSGISSEKDLFVSKFIHKSFLEVNEKGTVAAAATAQSVCGGGCPKVIKICCDHPFMFLIKHKPTQTILFCGRFVSP